MLPSLLLVFVHLGANVVWIGSALAVAVILLARSPDARTRGTLAYEVYKKLAVPAFGISFTAGVIRLILTPEYYFSDTKFMHAKLFFAFFAIGAHHALGSRAKRMASASVDGPGPARAMAAVVLVGALGAAFFAILKPF
jgi:uncharacterized membrane protein